MSQIWYYVKKGESQGPINQDEFDKLTANGTILPDTLVWRDGMGDWVASRTLANRSVAAGQPPASISPAFGQDAQGRHPARLDASTFMGALKDGFNRYIDFGTRSNRPQYWYWFLWMLIIGGITSMIDGRLGTSGIINGIWTLAVLVPGIAVGIRRLHDIGRTGWWLLIALVPLIGTIVLLVFFCTKSQDHTNQWGPVPR